MNKKTILLLVALFIMTSMFATQTRMSGLGNPTGLIEDDTDVFTYPATIFANSGVAVAELQQGAGSTQWNMSANIPILEYKLGVYLNRDTMIDLPGYGVDLDIAKSVEFNFGFMDKFAVGFGTSADYKTEAEFPLAEGTFKNEPKANFYSFFGGYSANGMDFGLRFEMASAEDVDNNGDFLEMSYTAFGLKGRHYIMNEENMSFLVQAAYMMSMEEYNYEDLEGNKLNKNEVSESMLEIGFGLQVKAGERNRILFGLTPIIYNPMSQEVTTYGAADDIVNKADDTWMFFPEYNLAVESKICSWLTGRLGANQVYAHVTEEMDFDETMAQEDTEDTFYAKNYNMNLGLTFSFGNFCLDTVLEQELLFEGPDFIGGNANGLATEVSVKYKF